MQSRLLKNILSVSGVLILVKALGFFKQMVIAGIFGANAETDLINLSYGFIGDIQYLLVQVMLTAVVSVYIHVKEENQDEAGRFASDTLCAGTIVATAISATVFMLSPWISKLLAPSYSQELSSQLGGYIRLFSPILIPLVWMAVFHALLNSNKRFIPGQLEGLYQSVILVIVIILGAPYLGVDSLVIGYWLYATFSAGLLGYQARTYLGKGSRNPFRNPQVRSLLAMVGPLFIGYGAVYINQMVDKILVSGLADGTVTAMSYAATLSNLVGTLICSLCSVLYAHVTEYISQEKEQAVAQLTERAILVLVILLLPVTVIAVSRAEDLVLLIYGRGAFDAEAAAMTAQALMGYSLSFIPLALREVYSRVQYGYQDSKHPAVNSVIGIACNVTLSILLCRKFGVFGVTLASSVATLVIGMLNVQSARRTASFLSLKSLWNLTPNILIGGILSILLTWGCKQWLAELPLLIRLCLTTFFVFSGYSVLVIPAVWKTGLIKPCHFSRKQR